MSEFLGRFASVAQAMSMHSTNSFGRMASLCLDVCETAIMLQQGQLPTLLSHPILSYLEQHDARGYLARSNV